MNHRFQSSHRIALNSVLLHRGHLPVASNETAFVKCFTYWHALHFHRIERCSCDCSSSFNASSAVFRIASSAAFSVLTAESINPAPTVEFHPQTFSVAVSISAKNMFSSYCTHI